MYSFINQKRGKGMAHHDDHWTDQAQNAKHNISAKYRNGVLDGLEDVFSLIEKALIALRQYYPSDYADPFRRILEDMGDLLSNTYRQYETLQCEALELDSTQVMTPAEAKDYIIEKQADDEYVMFKEG